MLIEIIKIILMAAAVVLLIIGFKHEDKFIRFELPYRIRFRKWLSNMLLKLRLFIAKRLRKSERFMKWLYEPSITEQIAQECNVIGVKIIRDWHNEDVKTYCRSFYI